MFFYVRIFTENIGSDHYIQDRLYQHEYNYAKMRIIHVKMQHNYINIQHN